MLGTTHMNDEKILVNFRIRETDADELRAAAKFLDIPQSQIIREAVKEKVAEIKQQQELAIAATN